MCIFINIHGNLSFLQNSNTENLDFCFFLCFGLLLFHEIVNHPIAAGLNIYFWLSFIPAIVSIQSLIMSLYGYLYSL